MIEDDELAALEAKIKAWALTFPPDDLRTFIAHARVTLDRVLR